jgi:hypothetical protein
VKIESEKDKNYKKEPKILRTEKDNYEQNIHHQKKVILFRKLKLWVLMGLRPVICISEQNIKVTGHIGQDRINEHIRGNFW